MAEFSPAGPVEEAANLFSLSQIRHLMRIEFSRAQRYSYPLACLVLEIDGLGAIRDERGYDVKESIVQEVIELLQEATRVCDYLGRMTNDRLMAILPHTGAAGAQTTAERLLLMTRELRLSGAEGLKVTLSVGSCHYSDGNTLFFDDLLDSAEAAAERAAEAGGDRFAAVTPGETHD